MEDSKLQDLELEWHNAKQRLEMAEGAVINAYYDIVQHVGSCPRCGNSHYPHCGKSEVSDGR